MSTENKLKLGTRLACLPAVPLASTLVCWSLFDWNTSRTSAVFPTGIYIPNSKDCNPSVEIAESQNQKIFSGIFGLLTKLNNEAQACSILQYRQVRQQNNNKYPHYLFNFLQSIDRQFILFSNVQRCPSQNNQHSIINASKGFDRSY